MADQRNIRSSTPFWNGLYFTEVSWNWSLVDKDFYQYDESNFMNWDSGQPSTNKVMPGCVVMTSSGMWRLHHCGNPYKPVCSNVTGQHVSFVFIDISMNWKAAQSYCREHLTDLAIPRNLSENEKIRALIPAGVSGWIGLYRVTWKWSDGAMFIWSPWLPGEPDEVGEKCTATVFNYRHYYSSQHYYSSTIYDGYWGAWPCDSRKPFICHHDPVPSTKQVVKVKLVGNSTLDLNDPAVLENLLKELKQKMKGKGVDTEIKLSWKKQQDGNVFYKEKKEEDQK
ncbi:C-type mannose receptor 2-like [Fundulus heteroclitus]|uniref:C-type mannose receptor 2-like n=1 Tax=Fundulus heteroclitus TaxID=8078 RepID=UPI00165C7C29|nr:C-type mannose receptor 2-like [Fundulus heteroclitus]